MARLRVWATRKEAALISKAARQQGVTATQFIRKIVQNNLASRKKMRKPKNRSRGAA